MLEDWVNSQMTPSGIGIDCVCISRMQALDQRLKGALVRGAFTERERALAGEASDYWSFLAGRFAVKEAVYKALSSKYPTDLDFRKIETLRRADGCPVLNPQSLPEFLQADTRVLVSITNEEDYAIALVQVVEDLRNDKK